jgi:subtilase family serine protease
LRAHTNIVFRSLDGTNKPTRMTTPGAINPMTVGQYVETPASLGCLYVSSPSIAGCVPTVAAGTGGPSAAGWGAIALVDAFDNPDAAGDLAAFDSYWGLPAANFTKIYANGNGDCTTPPANAGWSEEESLDIEYAHVYAPNAAIILVEACSNSNTDLYYAEGVAIDYIAANYGGGQVSNSWGGAEYSGENSSDPDFAGWNYGAYTEPIVTFASAGDNGCGAAYPSSNPWIVSAGGTSIYRTTTNGRFNYEGCWSGSGGGTSTEEIWAPATATGGGQPSFTGSNTGPWADYQYPIFAFGNRATPDFASNADPNSGVYIYNAYALGGWSCCWGGTSESSPSLAAIVNRANNRLSTCWFNPVNGHCQFYNAENTLLYSQLPTHAAYSKNFYDVTKGTNGCTVSKGWDYCTGVGSPRGLLGK